jgi:hypothetical protein
MIHQVQFQPAVYTLLANRIVPLWYPSLCQKLLLALSCETISIAVTIALLQQAGMCDREQTRC